jgi:hypothetical protein
MRDEAPANKDDSYGNRTEWNENAEELDESGGESNEIAPRLYEGVPNGTSTRTLGDDGIRLMHGDCKRTHGGARAKVSEATLVTLDFLADARELTLDREYVREFARACREQIDEALLESARIRNASLSVYELFADILYGDIH